MLRAIRLLALPVIAAGLLLMVTATEAQAQIRVQVGGFGLHGAGAYRGASVYRGGHHYYPNRVQPSYRQGYNHHAYNHQAYRVPQIRSYGYGHGYYHDTSHYDYHAPQLRWHGNHWDYQPGHYDLHRTGHFHH